MYVDICLYNHISNHHESSQSMPSLQREQPAGASGPSTDVPSEMSQQGVPFADSAGLSHRLGMLLRKELGFVTPI